MHYEEPPLIKIENRVNNLVNDMYISGFTRKQNRIHKHKMSVSIEVPLDLYEPSYISHLASTLYQDIVCTIIDMAFSAIDEREFEVLDFTTEKYKSKVIGTEYQSQLLSYGISDISSVNDKFFVPAKINSVITYNNTFQPSISITQVKHERLFLVGKLFGRDIINDNNPNFTSNKLYMCNEIFFDISGVVVTERPGQRNVYDFSFSYDVEVGDGKPVYVFMDGLDKNGQILTKYRRNKMLKNIIGNDINSGI